VLVFPSIALLKGLLTFPKISIPNDFSTISKNLFVLPSKYVFPKFKTFSHEKKGPFNQFGDAEIIKRSLLGSS
jgi:hypothetical protein